MKMINQRNELNYDLICKAVKGSPEALKEVLLYYDHYIDALSAYEVEGEDGVAHRRIDPDMKAEMQCRLIEAIKKWRELLWIENCDSKTSIILGGIGVIVGILLASDYISNLKRYKRYISVWLTMQDFEPCFTL